MWNYRVVEVKDLDDEILLDVREVYYDKDDQPYGHCPAEVFGKDIEELQRVMAKMREAFSLPFLKDVDLTGNPKL